MKKFMMLILSGVSVIVLSGCVNMQDTEGWKGSQKDEFLDILKVDKYASICNEQALYNKVKESENSKRMSALLVAYTRNLANGCIDLKGFKVSQEEQRERKIATQYDTYLQTVKTSDIMMKLKAGQSIEQILAPYLPEYRQFMELVSRYNSLKKDPATSAETLHKLRLNIERVKLLKSGLGGNYALINIPEYVVRVMDNQKQAVSMAVVVGKKHMQTPIFSADLQYITLNPQWSVPDSIARNEVIPKLLKDPGYLTKKRMVMRSDYNLDSKELTPGSVDLNAYVGGEGYVPFKFIEIPSKKNGLGRVKFIFPNSYSVYMHDTQSKSLFKRTVRTYSHGCIRLAEPNAMLKYVSENYTSKTPEEVKEKYDSLKTAYISLNKRLPVHTAYLTTYVNDAGELLVFNDIYGFDKTQKLNF